MVFLLLDAHEIGWKNALDHAKYSYNVFNVHHIDLHWLGGDSFIQFVS